MASNNPTPIKTTEATICAIKHAWPGRKQIFEVAHTAQVTNINKYYVYITVRVSGTQLICSSENMVFSLHWFCKSLQLFGGKTYLKKACTLWLFCWQNPAWVPWYSKAQYRPSPRWHLSLFNQLMVHGMVGMKLVIVRAEFWYPKLYLLNSVWGVFPNSSSWAFAWK